MTHDVTDFVHSIVAARREAGLPVISASDQIIDAETRRFRLLAGMPLPSVYIEICRIKDGFGDDSGAELYGLGTYFEGNSEYPAYEGLMEVHERNTIDLGPQELIEFGNREEGTEPWGWNLRLGSFVRSDPNRRDAMAEFSSFEEMFRALFWLDGQ